jgi:hypothetical protein
MRRKRQKNEMDTNLKSSCQLHSRDQLLLKQARSCFGHWCTLVHEKCGMHYTQMELRHYPDTTATQRQRHLFTIAFSTGLHASPSTSSRLQARFHAAALQSTQPLQQRSLPRRYPCPSAIGPSPSLLRRSFVIG